MKNGFRWFFAQNWVLAGEHLVLRLGSFGFSMVSAHAIFWFFDSLATLEGSDPLQRYVPYVIAGGFGLLGYFVSRGLVYRMLRKERIRVYMFICVLFEFVEIVCNFAQAVSSVPNAHWLLKIAGWPHLILLVALYIAYSIVPAVTFVLAVVDMDMEKEKSSAGSAVRPGYRAAPASSAAPARVYRPAAPQITQAQTQALGNGQTQGQGPGSPGWKFPFRQRSSQDAAQNGHGSPMPVIMD
ncbi:MAG: hypothetical protein ACJ788_06375 [Ktedonobacteraceae bacterium]